MGLYKPAPGISKADATAFANSLAALDAAMTATFGYCVVSGFVLSTSGIMSAGLALVGHVVAESGGTNLSSKFSGSGSFDLYVQYPVFSQPAGASATPGTYPAANGQDAAQYVVVPAGASPGSLPSAMLATVTVSGGAITSVNNLPAGRVNLTTPQNLSASLNRLLTKESTFPGVLTAPLAVPLAWLVPTNIKIVSLTAAVLTAPSSQPILLNVYRRTPTGATSAIWTSGNAPSIAAGALTGGSSVAPDGVSALNTNDMLLIDLAQVGAGTAGSTLAVNVNYLLN